ncbi:MAG: tyrosinase [Desulforhopalus sp.]|jgi:tyrosinase
MGCRKNLNKLTPTERTSFVNAFIQLMENGTTDEYAQIHGGAGGHGHGGPAFVAWHREFVRRFELDLQAIDASVTLPYWDWTTANLNSAGTESLIWRDDFLGGPGDNSGGGPPTGPSNGYPITTGPFAGRYTRRPFDIFTFPGTGGTIATRMANSDFNQFRLIEGPHGSAHVFIGGHIMPFNATAGTPDFWLIHCNVDRLWAEWIRQHESTPGFEPYKPLVGGPTGHNLGDTMWPWNGTSLPFSVLPWTNSPEMVHPQDLLDHRALGYEYDTIDQCGTGPKPIKEFLPKEFQPKELKEFQPKEFQPKELKEFRPKEFQPKEFQPKEIKEGSPKEFFEGPFIDPRRRPDLTGAGLGFEPDINDTELEMLRNDVMARRANLLRR